MASGDWLQVIGGLIELSGLALIALGIRDARLGFDPTRPSLVMHARSGVRRVVAKVRKPKPKTVTLAIGNSVLGHTASKVRVRVSFAPWDDVSVEERIERLKQRVEAYQDTFAVLDDKIDGETKAREEAAQSLAQRVTGVEERLGERVKQVATGGLRRETWGVLLFAVGLVLQVWGSIVSG